MAERLTPEERLRPAHGKDGLPVIHGHRNWAACYDCSIQAIRDAEEDLRGRLDALLAATRTMLDHEFWQGHPRPPHEAYQKLEAAYERAKGGDDGVA